LRFMYFVLAEFYPCLLVVQGGLFWNNLGLVRNCWRDLAFI